MTKTIVRFMLPLFAVLAILAYASLPYAEHIVDQWFERDLKTRARVIFDTLQGAIDNLPASESKDVLQHLQQRLVEGGDAWGIGYCNAQGKLAYSQGTFPYDFMCEDYQTLPGITKFAPWHGSLDPLLIASFPFHGLESQAGTLVVLNDTGSIERRLDHIRIVWAMFLLMACFMTIVSTVLATDAILEEWLKMLRLSLQKEEDSATPHHQSFPGKLRPLVLTLYRLMRRRAHSRRIVNPTQAIWTKNSLQKFLQTELLGKEIIAVSNREPFIHHDDHDQITVNAATGGLVTAIDPIMRACKGTWVAHGSGSGDKKSVDHHDRLKVPPNNPLYTLRRVWLNEEEENGFYHGFANEGLWPLCHMVFTRPVFRDNDWEHYQKVNRKFADAVAAEAKTKNPIVMVQDYHFSLLPAMIHEKLPQAIVATFWHIPWPNAETFSICPWREDILKGMLGSDILGFHTRFHCTNFLDTVDRFLECRIDREHNTVTIGGRTVLVRPYPISIEWPPSVATDMPAAVDCRDNILKQLRLPAGIKLGVGVERFDYTKGIVDRFQAIARFFRENPSWIGRLVFVQVASPTRGKIQRYQEIQEETVKIAEAINTQLGRDGWKPIILAIEHYDQRRVFELFRAADFCIVSSLHDGMNLVAKEFVAARDDERGVLILSTFAGASEELLEALIVNPHDTKGMASSIDRALRMSSTEQTERMRLLRSVIRDHNVYWWAGRILMDVTQVRKGRLMSNEILPSRAAEGLRALLSPQSALGKWLPRRNHSRAA